MSLFGKIDFNSEINPLNSDMGFSGVSTNGKYNAPLFNFAFSDSYGFEKSGKSPYNIPEINAKLHQIGVSSWSYNELSDNHKAIMQSQRHLIDLIKYYEGDRFNSYCGNIPAYSPRDNLTVHGYGEINLKKDYKSEEEAFNGLIKSLEVHTADLIRNVEKKCGKGSWEKLPASICEGLIDLCYNRGYGAIASKDDVIFKAIKSEDYSTIVKSMVSVSDDPSAPGLYRRSLSRMILALRDLKGWEARQTRDVIEETYEDALDAYKKYKKPASDLEMVWEGYRNGKISGKPTSARSYKIHVGNEYKGKGFRAICNAEYDKQALTDSIITREEFYKKLMDYNRNPKVLKLGTYLKVPDVRGSLGTITQNTPIMVNEEVKKNAEAAAAARKASKSANQAQSQQNNTYIQDEIADDSVTPLKRILSGGNYKIAEKGDFEIISVDYKIIKGDTMYAISDKFGLDKSVICDNNNIKDPNSISENQVIKINKLGYKIKSGDTLAQIAKKFGLTVSMLQSINNFDDTNIIKAGDIIEIPGFVHKVRKGDNLNQISKKTGVSLDALMKINGLKTDKIYPDQNLIILYNNSDYAVSDDKKKITNVKSKTGESLKVEEIDLSSDTSLKNYPLLQKKMRINGRVVATRKVFEPTKKGKLSGKTIIVNAGHGYSESGKDPGVAGRKGLPYEWLINYNNAMLLVEQLRAQGAKVIYLQGQKALITSALKQKSNKADLFISVHANSASNTKDRTQFFVRKNDVQKGTASNTFARIAEKNFDKWIPEHEKIKSSDAFTFQGKKDYAQVSVNDGRTGILNSAQRQGMPGIIWEVAYVTTDKGCERLKDKNLMKNYATVMANSVTEYFSAKMPAKKTHTIASGETLGGIAQKYKVTVADIKKANSLKNDYITVGQTLIIPSAK